MTASERVICKIPRVSGADDLRTILASIDDADLNQLFDEHYPTDSVEQARLKAVVDRARAKVRRTRSAVPALNRVLDSTAAD